MVLVKIYQLKHRIRQRNSKILQRENQRLKVNCLTTKIFLNLTCTTVRQIQSRFMLLQK